jgi:hypothetical protein
LLVSKEVNEKVEMIAGKWGEIISADLRGSFVYSCK